MPEQATHTQEREEERQSENKLVELVQTRGAEPFSYIVDKARDDHISTIAIADWHLEDTMSETVISVMEELVARQMDIGTIALEIDERYQDAVDDFIQNKGPLPDIFASYYFADKFKQILFFAREHQIGVACVDIVEKQLLRHLEESMDSERTFLSFSFEDEKAKAVAEALERDKHMHQRVKDISVQNMQQEKLTIFFVGHDHLRNINTNTKQPLEDASYKLGQTLQDSYLAIGQYYLEGFLDNGSGGKLLTSQVIEESGLVNATLSRAFPTSIDDCDIAIFFPVPKGLVPNPPTYFPPIITQD